MYAIMMLCHNGTYNLVGTGSSMRYEYGKHVIVASQANTEEEAVAEYHRLQPERGTFNREEIQCFVLPWEDRWNPRRWPQRAIPYWGN